MKQNKFSLYLTYTDREVRAFKSIPDFVEKGILPANKNEILRRGLYCCLNLAEVDEEVLLTELVHFMEPFNEKEIFADPDTCKAYFNILKSLAFSVQAILVAKYGIQYADTFTNIISGITAVICRVNEISSSEKTKKQHVSGQLEERIKALISTIRTMFMKVEN